MDQRKVGELLRKLRKEKGMTQRSFAQQIGVSDKTVSKWECGLGLPDLATLPQVSRMLGVDLQSMLSGELEESRFDGGNMKRIAFYVCPVCGNVITMTGKAEVSCCGRRLEALTSTPVDDAHRLSMQPMDGEMYVSFAHGMEKEHHIRFIACAGYDRLLLVRLYPEQGSELRMPYMPRGTYYIGCSADGLFVQRS